MDKSEALARVKAYTVVLWLFGIGFLGSAAAIRAVTEEFVRVFDGLPGGAEGARWALVMAPIIPIVVAAAFFLVATLRSIGARAASAATAAISVLLVFCFPLGTAAFAWWFMSVRKRESRIAAA